MSVQSLQLSLGEPCSAAIFEQVQQNHRSGEGFQGSRLPLQ